VRRPGALALVAFALLAAPTPEAVAQAPPRPEPRELWQQFPLETGRSNSRAPAERESTPEVSVPTTRGTPAEGKDGSVATVQIAAVVLAMALVLMLTTGVLAYAARGQFEFGFSPRRRRRLAQSFREFRAAPPVEVSPHAETERPERREPNAERMVRGPGRPRRRAKRAAAARAVASITSEVDALRAKLDVDAAPKKSEGPTQDRIERLRERLNMYFGSAKNVGTANDEVESLKAKLDVHRAPAKSESIPHDERERLKEKLGAQPAYAETASYDERQTLKEKLGKQAAAPKGVSTTQEELETLKAKLAKQAALATAERETAEEAAPKKELSGVAAAAKRELTVRAPLESQLVDNGTRPTSEREVDLHADKPSPQLDVSDRPAKDRARASRAVDALHTTLREPPGKRAASAAPVGPRPVPAATRRSTIAELLTEHGSMLAQIGLVLILLTLLLLNIAVLFDIGVAS
jgi:hypothetical protein